MLAHTIMNLPESRDYSRILLESSGLLDVRAPIEFHSGAFPHAENHPLLDDEERHRVGICYKDNGPHAAIDLGHQLVSGHRKQARIDNWLNFVSQHNSSYLYCFRGGLRSKISQQWLQEAGFEITRVHGGFKALRNFLIDQLKEVDQLFDFVLIGGLTGCKKTDLVNDLHNGIDLEGAAYHRGSSFGAHATKQNSQINFENKIAIDFLKANLDNYHLIALEDESRFIGSVDIPKNIFSKMRSSSLVVIEHPLEQRVEQLLTEYVINMEHEFSLLHNQQELAFQAFSNYLVGSLERIQKRLGMDSWKNLHSSMQDALIQHNKFGDASSHKRWIEPLLKEYYDPMYSSQLEKRKNYIKFRGNYDECKQYISETTRLPDSYV